MRAAAVMLLAALGCSSCATTTVRSGKPPGKTAAGVDDKWHVAFLFGTVEGPRDYDLRELCPDGWAEINTATDPFTVMAGALTLWIYSPSRLTVVCARRPGDEKLSF